MTDDEVARIAAHFADPPWSYPNSPLYRALAPAVAQDRAIHELLAERRPGQQPSFLLFGAVHGLLLAGVDHPLRGYYPSIVGAAALPAAEAGPAFLDFCHAYRDELAAIVRRRLVQTNVVTRACGLAFALAAIGRRCAGPVHLVEVGSSAGLLLRFDRYRLELGDRAFGDLGSPVVARTEWRSDTPVPDLDARPAVASRIGVDLAPVDVRDPDERAWLRALVWPEDAEKVARLAAALDLAAADPPVFVKWPNVQRGDGQMSIVAGDAIDVLPELAARLPVGEPRVAFHFSVRMHVPPERRAAFDAAIDALGEGGPLFHVWLEPPNAPHHPWAADPRGALELHGPGDAQPVPLARVHGHLDWLAPLE
jgi:hypothetical protein